MGDEIVLFYLNVNLLVNFPRVFDEYINVVGLKLYMLFNVDFDDDYLLCVR